MGADQVPRTLPHSPQAAMGKGQEQHRVNEMPVVNLCYCTCGGREAARLLEEDPTANVGRTLILCRCCDLGKCPAHPEPSTDEPTHWKCCAHFVSLGKVCDICRHDINGVICKCGELKANGRPTGSYNLNPDCPVHG